MSAALQTSAPVALFVYGRPEHTRRTLISLRDNVGAQGVDLHIFSDGPRDDSMRQRVELVRSEALSLESRGWFRSVTVNASAENRGLAGSVIAGVSALLSRYDSVIVLEDDLLLSPAFLEFMNRGLLAYKEHPLVWSLTGFSPEIGIDRLQGSDVFLSPRGGSWGWATWRDRWSLIDWNVSDYREFECSLRRRRAFNRGGRDLSAMLDAQMDGRIDSWAVRWCYSEFCNDMYTVYPASSLVSNIGLDGSGTHKVRERSDSGSPWLHRPDFFFPIDIEPDSEIIRQFAVYFSRYNKCPPWSFVRHLAAEIAPRMWR